MWIMSSAGRYLNYDVHLTTKVYRLARFLIRRFGLVALFGTETVGN